MTRKVDVIYTIAVLFSQSVVTFLSVIYTKIETW